MRALFFMKHAGAIRNLESVVTLLAERGHEVELAFDTVKTEDSLDAVRNLAAAQPGLTWGKAPSTGKAALREAARSLRSGMDYLRYLEPPYRDADALRERARREAPRSIRAAGAAARRVGAVPALRRVLSRIERSLPPAAEVSRFIAERAPDIVLVTPLVGIGSAQADLLRAARHAGIPTVLPVLSWDNLTNKGLLRDLPDLTLVWNEAQAQEAETLHGVPRERIEVTGASAYDHWFAWRPSTDRSDFCRRVGLPLDRPFVLWVCSSPFVAPDEVSFVRRWLAAVRAPGSPVRNLGVLVRPHPQNASQWAGVDLDDQAAAVWPRDGEDPLEAAARRHYFDSIHHAAAVAGINTSAQIEGAIVGRPVHTILAEEFRGTQAGTLHFHHLAADRGHLVVASSLEEHVELLARSLRQPDEERRRRFLERFVRPYGLDEPATPRMVDAIERAGGAPVAPVRPPLEAPLVRAALRPLDGRLRRRRQASKAARHAAGLDDARRMLAALAETEGPVVAGPWLGEVGYELLYWVPFLRRATETVPGLGDRLVVLSRGGTGSWYSGFAGRYVELYDHVHPERLVERLGAVSAETGGYRKQYTETSLDQELVAAAVGPELRRSSGRLHPRVMFGAYRALAKAGIPPEESGLFSFAPLEVRDSEATADLDLPSSFTAVRFYFSPSLPETAENGALAAAAVARLADRGDIVILTPPGKYDDHRELELAASGRIRRLGHLMSPSNNLAVQTAAVARAGAFVGTYGGLSYLPLFLGVPTLALHSEPRFRERHLALARRLSARPGFGAYDARSTDRLDVTEAIDALAAVDERVAGRRRE